MSADPEAMAFDLGQRLRRARHRRGMTQQEVAEAAGISTSAVSRMELGLGSTAPLRSWVAVADAVGHDLFGAPTEKVDVFVAALERLLASGGWVIAGRRDDLAWFDRGPRPAPFLRRVLLPAERVVLQVVMTVTDMETARRRLQDAVREIRETTPLGRVVEGALVIVRSTTAVRRLSGTPWRRSTPGWISAFRAPEAAVPLRPGVVWLAPRGTHLLPGG